MQDVETVPPVLHDPGGECGLGEASQNGDTVRPGESAGADDHHWLGHALRRLYPTPARASPVPRPGSCAVGQIGLWADDAYRRAAPEPTLADPRVEDRRLVARVRADDENRVSLIDAGDGRVEKIGRAAKLGVQFRAVLTAVDIGRAELGEKRLEREHFFDRRQVADDRPDPGGKMWRRPCRRPRRRPPPSSRA